MKLLETFKSVDLKSRRYQKRIDKFSRDKIDLNQNTGLVCKHRSALEMVS